MAQAIVVVGANGRMGSLIASLATSNPDYTLVGAVDSKAQLAALQGKLGGVCTCGSDLTEVLGHVSESKAVVIDFTAPEVSLNSARICAQASVPLVIGTTGLNREQVAELEQLAMTSPMFWSTNMSIGVSVMRKLLPSWVKALGPNYDLEIMEIHHKHKKDAPSGTAKTLAAELAKARGWEPEEVRKSARDGLIGERGEQEIGVQAIRGGDVVGVHTVYFMGPGERIEITHHAHSRENFAQGALRAAAWLSSQPCGRLYSMPDVIED